MGKIKDAFKDGRIVGGAVLVAGTAIIGVGVVNFAAAAAQQPAAVVETADPALTIDLTDTPYTNGLASEQESEAAAIEQARLAAEAEAARVAAEQAAAAEAARIAAEQAAAEQQAAAEEPSEDPEPSDDSDGRIPATWVDLGNGTGMWDFSHCPSGSGSTGSDGNVYCN